MDFDSLTQKLVKLVGASPESQAAIARKAGVTGSYVTLLLKGERPNVGLETLAEVVKAAGGDLVVEVVSPESRQEAPPAPQPTADKLAPLIAAAKDLDVDSIAVLVALAPNIHDTTLTHREIFVRLAAEDAAAAKARRAAGG